MRGSAKLDPLGHSSSPRDLGPLQTRHFGRSRLLIFTFTHFPSLVLCLRFIIRHSGVQGEWRAPPSRALEGKSHWWNTAVYFGFKWHAIESVLQSMGTFWQSYGMSVTRRLFLFSGSDTTGLGSLQVGHFCGPRLVFQIYFHIFHCIIFFSLINAVFTGLMHS